MKRRWSQIGIVLGALLVGFIVYRPALHAYFLSDDFDFLFDVQRRGFSAVWTVFPRCFLRPFVLFSFWLDGTIWGSNAWGYHLTNLLLHTANALLMAKIAGCWLREIQWPMERVRGPALLAGLIFLVHPSHTEAVSWISGRSDVIAVFWALASLAAYFRYRRDGHSKWLFGSLALYLCALLSKESVVTFPLIIAVLEGMRSSDRLLKVRTWLPSSGYFICVLMYVLFRGILLGEWVGGYGSVVRPQLSDPLWLRNLIFYTARTLVPAVDWNVNPYVLPIGKTCLAVVLAVSVWSLVRKWIRRRRNGDLARICEFPGWAFALAACYLISLLPVLDIMNLGVHLRAFFGERLIYWPSVFTTLILVSAIGVLWDIRRNIALFLFVALSTIYAASLYHANQAWREAGGIARNIVRDVRQLEPGRRLFVLNAPDALKGAYIFRNGLRATLRLWDEKPRFEEIHILAFQNIGDIEDGASVSTANESSYEVKCEGESTYFFRPARNAGEPPLFAIGSFGRSGYKVRILSLGAEDRVVYYSKGRLCDVH